jgi:dTMP kinase
MDVNMADNEIKKGRFIVIDGSDGSGKGTQTDLIIKALLEKGKSVYKCDFPNYDGFFGKMVGQYLNSRFGDPTKLDPYLASLMYAGDRWLEKDKIKDALSEGKIVIANRYVQSNMAHQGSKLDPREREDFVNWIKELEFDQYKIPVPDLVIVLYMPAEISQKLVDTKDKREYTDKKRDGHESDRNYLSKTAEYYKELAAKEGWTLIECVKDGKLLSIEEVFKLVKSEILKLIS